MATREKKDKGEAAANQSKGTPPLAGEPLNEARRQPRFVVNREFASLQELFSEYVANVSRSGAFIRTDEPLPIGTRVTLKFTIVLDELETIEGTGRVVRIVAPGSGQEAGMGVVFEELSGYSIALLEKLFTRPPGF